MNGALKLRSLADIIADMPPDVLPGWPSELRRIAGELVEMTRICRQHFDDADPFDYDDADYERLKYLGGLTGDE